MLKVNPCYIYIILYIQQQDVCLVVAYLLRNGWTDLAELFLVSYILVRGWFLAQNFRYGIQFYPEPGSKIIWAKNHPLTKTELTKKYQPNRSSRSGGDRPRPYKHPVAIWIDNSIRINKRTFIVRNPISNLTVRGEQIKIKNFSPY